jgi:hypothetical protein
MQLSDPKRYLEEAGRPWEIGVGIVVAGISALFLLLAGVVIVRGIERGLLEPPLFEHGKLMFMIVPLVLLALGIPGAWIAFRLISGRRRKDGGLMSPFALRVFGVLLIVSPWFVVVADRRHAWHWLHVLPMTGAGIACWILAARREKRDAPEESISPPAAKPID